MENDFALRPDWLQTIKSNGNLETIGGTVNCGTQIPNATCD